MVQKVKLRSYTIILARSRIKRAYYKQQAIYILSSLQKQVSIICFEYMRISIIDELLGVEWTLLH